jgi:hypothetical protein
MHRMEIVWTFIGNRLYINAHELTLLGITDILCGHFLSWGPYFTLFCVVFVH